MKVAEIYEFDKSYQKKTPTKEIVDKFECIKDSYKYITRPDGKPFSEIEKRVFNLFEQLTNRGETIIDYPWLQEKFCRSHRTIYRILQNLGLAFNSEFYNSITIKGKRYRDKILISRTQEFQNILDEALKKLSNSKYRKQQKLLSESIQNDNKGGQKWQQGWTKMATPIYKEERIQEEGKEEEPKGYSSFPKKEKSKKKKKPSLKQRCQEEVPACTYGFVDEPAHAGILPHHQEKEDASPSSITVKPQKVTPMKNPNIEQTADKKLMLNKAILKDFPGIIGNDILKNYEFLFEQPDKLKIHIKSNFQLNEINKNTLRNCIWKVYGKGIKIMVNRTKTKPTAEIIKMPIAPKEEEEKPVVQHHQYEQLKQELLNLGERGILIVNHWLSNLMYSKDSKDNHIVLTGSIFFADYIYQNYEGNISRALEKLNMSLEIQPNNNSHPCEFNVKRKTFINNLEKRNEN